ncbi:hypothetical protein ACN27G_07430 [Plantactinospora sp. WMMB334]|uniref:hypothetical protein n=1 Tax=Plantactinospora sp. WMMB334 TaxID=3404119 RepID=UPI003B951DCD
MAVLLGVELLLTALAIGAAALEQPALAVMAGTAAVTLAGEIVRRFLTPPAALTPPATERQAGPVRAETDQVASTDVGDAPDLGRGAGGPARGRSG